jgi:hypothetical protein
LDSDEECTAQRSGGLGTLESMTDSWPEYGQTANEHSTTTTHVCQCCYKALHWVGRKVTGPSRMALESEIPSASPMDLGLVTWWSELQWASMSTCL